MSEDRLQQECYMWFHNTYPHLRGCLFSVPNGSYKATRQRKLFKQTGLYPGVSDMLLMHNGTTYCFELKTERGRQSDKQLAWQATIEEQGFCYFIIRTDGLFKSIVKNIICN